MPIFFTGDLISGQTTAGCWAATTSSTCANTIWLNVVGTGSGTTTGSALGDWGFPMGSTNSVTSIACQQQAINTMYAQQAAAHLAAYNAAPTAAEIETRIAEQRAFTERARAREAERSAARARARELLLEHLTPAQRKTFEKNAWFVVEGGRSKKHYRIEARGVAGNVSLLNKRGEAVATYCGHADHSIPDYDQYLAQKLMLEANEDAYLALANRRLVAG